MKRRPPENPITQEQRLFEERIRKSSRAGTAVRFVTKEFFQFILVVILMLVLNAALITALFVVGVGKNVSGSDVFGESIHIREGMIEKDGTYELNPLLKKDLEDRGVWFVLLSDQGKLLYKFNTPANLKVPKDAAELYSAAHYGKLDNYIVYGFPWEDQDNTQANELLLMGYHHDPAYRIESLHFNRSDIDFLITCVPWLILVNLVVAFLIYLIRRSSLLNKTAPLMQGISDLADGKNPQLPLMGDFSQLSYQINQASNLLANRDQARLDWIRGVSHDIRTPLTSIIVYSENLVNQTALGSSERKQLESIASQALRIRDLLDDFGILQIIDYDLAGIELTSLHPAKLLRTIATNCCNELDENLYEIELEMDARMQTLEVLGNERLLRRGIQNLISNAVVHNPQGCRISISAQCEEDPKSWSVSVGDNGCGIDDSILTELREKLKSARENNDKGCKTSQHGLGLLLVQKIALIHTGSLEVSSKLGKGFKADIRLSVKPKN